MAADDDDDSDASAGPSSEHVAEVSSDLARRLEQLDVAAGHESDPPAEVYGESDELLESFQDSLQSLVQLDVLLKMQISAIEESIAKDSRLGQLGPPPRDADPYYDDADPYYDDAGGRLPAQTSFLGFEKLSGKENYHQWSLLIRLVLERLDLWTTVSVPTLSAPSPTPILASDVVPNEKDALAYSYISLSVCDYILPGIERHKSGRAAWQTLERLYGQVSLLDRIVMERKMCARISESQSIRRHIKRLLAAVEYLRWAGETIDDDDVVRKILCSLPDSCDAFIRTLSSEQLASSKSVIQAVLVLERR